MRLRQLLKGVWYSFLRVYYRGKFVQIYMNADWFKPGDEVLSEFTGTIYRYYGKGCYRFSRQMSRSMYTTIANDMGLDMLNLVIPDKGPLLHLPPAKSN